MEKPEKEKDERGEMDESTYSHTNRFALFTKSNALKGGERKEVLDEYRRAFAVYYDLATARLPKGGEAAKLDADNPKHRFRFLLKDWVVVDSAADELRQTKTIKDYHEFFNALELIVDTTKTQCSMRFTEWMQSASVSQSAHKLLNVTTEAFDEMFDKYFEPSESLKRHLDSLEKENAVKIRSEMKDSFTECWSKFVLMSSAGEHFLVSQWDSKIKSPADMTSYELASTIQNRFLTPQCKQIRLPIEVKERGIHFPLNAQQPTKNDNSSRPKPAQNVLLGKGTSTKNSSKPSHVTGDKSNSKTFQSTNNSNYSNSNSKKLSDQPKRKLEQGQLWDERLCTICKESGRNEKVYLSHDTADCRYNTKKTKTNDNTKK